MNVAILSMILGDELRMAKSEVVQLGLAGLLADIALAPLGDTVANSRKLTNKEYDEIRKHPLDAKRALAVISGLEPGRIVPAIEQHHERLNGSGYPGGLRSGEIDLFAQVVGLADVYEALTHDRPHREKSLPYTVMKDLAGSMKDLFAAEPLRALIARLAIYPPGSYVMLTTGEVARVYTVNKNAPLRPVVDVVFDSQRKPAKRVARIDLKEHPTLYIRRPVDTAELEDAKS